MTDLFRDPDPTEAFYAQALATLSKPRHRKARIARALNAIYWTAILLALSWLASQALDRAVPVEHRAQTLIGTGATPGAPLKVAYQLTRHRVCATDVSWTEIDGAGEVHRFGPQHVPIPGKLGPDAFTRAWATSPNAAPGPSVLRVVLEYQCPGNYLHALYPVVEELPDMPYETIGQGGVPGDGTTR